MENYEIMTKRLYWITLFLISLLSSLLYLMKVDFKWLIYLNKRVLKIVVLLYLFVFCQLKNLILLAEKMKTKMRNRPLDSNLGQKCDMSFKSLGKYLREVGLKKELYEVLWSLLRWRGDLSELSWAGQTRHDVIIVSDKNVRRATPCWQTHYIRPNKLYFYHNLIQHRSHIIFLTFPNILVYLTYYIQRIFAKNCKIIEYDD